MTERESNTLKSLAAVAEDRKRAIFATQRQRRELDAYVARRLAEIRATHREASVRLVEAVGTARRNGIRAADIWKRIGMTSQNFNQLKRALEARQSHDERQDETSAN